MGKELYTAKQFIDAIPGTGGIVATIADRVGCKWHTAKKYIEEYPTVKEVYEDECERIRDGDIPTAKWYLTKKRKDEFGDAIDVTSGGKPLIIDWDDDN